MSKGKNTVKQQAAAKVSKMAMYLTENSVGKSLPMWVHEVKVPEELKIQKN